MLTLVMVRQQAVHTHAAKMHPDGNVRLPQKRPASDTDLGPEVPGEGESPAKRCEMFDFRRHCKAAIAAFVDSSLTQKMCRFQISAHESRISAQ